MVHDPSASSSSQSISSAGNSGRSVSAFTSALTSHKGGGIGSIDVMAVQRLLRKNPKLEDLVSLARLDCDLADALSNGGCDKPPSGCPGCDRCRPDCTAACAY